MASINYALAFERRRAIYRPTVNRSELGIKKGEEIHCRVFGCYQVCDGEDVNPYFVVELASGRCTYVSPEHLQFIHEDDEYDAWLMYSEEVASSEKNNCD